jgi:hypothetical protein
MTIAEFDKVDAIGIDPETGHSVMLLSDHLEWGSDDIFHMYLLQEKINAYLAMIGSGEFLAKYPKGIGRRVTILIWAKYEMNDAGRRFFDQVHDHLRKDGITLKFYLVPDDESDQKT